MYFPWGLDETHVRCRGLKYRLKETIISQRKKNVTTFDVAMDCGVGLYAAEIINELRQEDTEISLYCHIPYEQQHVKWPDDLQTRYFNALADCTRVVPLSRRPIPGHTGMTRLATAEYADTMIIVRSREEPEDEVEVLYDVVKRKGCWVVDVFPPDRMVAK